MKFSQTNGFPMVFLWFSYGSMENLPHLLMIFPANKTSISATRISQPAIPQITSSWSCLRNPQRKIYNIRIYHIYIYNDIILCILLYFILLCIPCVDSSSVVYSHWAPKTPRLIPMNGVVCLLFNPYLLPQKTT